MARAHVKVNCFLTQFRDKNEEKFRSVLNSKWKLFLFTGTNLSFADVCICPLYQIHGAVWFDELFNLPNLEVSISVFIQINLNVQVFLIIFHILIKMIFFLYKFKNIKKYLHTITLMILATTHKIMVQNADRWPYNGHSSTHHWLCRSSSCTLKMAKVAFMSRLPAFYAIALNALNWFTVQKVSSI